MNTKSDKEKLSSNLFSMSGSAGIQVALVATNRHTKFAGGN